jgi:hypothetical protein
MQQSQGKGSSSAYSSSCSILWTIRFLNKNKSVRVSWLTESATPCVEISSRAKTVRLNLEQWTNLKNYAPFVKDFFSTLSIPSSLDSFVQFKNAHSGNPYVKLGNLIDLKSADWEELVKSFESIDSCLKVVYKLNNSDVNSLVDAFVNSLYHDESCPKFTSNLFSMAMRGCI